MECLKEPSRLYGKDGGPGAGQRVRISWLLE